MAQGQAPGREQTRSRLGRGPRRDLPDEYDQVEGGRMTTRHIEALGAIAFGLVVVLTLTGGG